MSVSKQGVVRLQKSYQSKKKRENLIIKKIKKIISINRMANLPAQLNKHQSNKLFVVSFKRFKPFTTKERLKIL
jgi:hypothetical protein